jgi:hypothetical protein
MQPLIQKNASTQVEQMAELLSDKPACNVFKQRLLEAGKGSPYEVSTQWKLAHTQQDACAAGCRLPAAVDSGLTAAPKALHFQIGIAARARMPCAPNIRTTLSVPDSLRR